MVWIFIIIAFSNGSNRCLQFLWYLWLVILCRRRPRMNSNIIIYHFVWFFFFHQYFSSVNEWMCALKTTRSASYNKYQQQYAEEYISLHTHKAPITKWIVYNRCDNFLLIEIGIYASILCVNNGIFVEMVLFRTKLLPESSHKVELVWWINRMWYCVACLCQKREYPIQTDWKNCFNTIYFIRLNVPNAKMTENGSQIPFGMHQLTICFEAIKLFNQTDPFALNVPSSLCRWMLEWNKYETVQMREWKTKPKKPRSIPDLLLRFGFSTFQSDMKCLFCHPYQFHRQDKRNYKYHTIAIAIATIFIIGRIFCLFNLRVVQFFVAFQPYQRLQSVRRMGGGMRECLAAKCLNCVRACVCVDMMIRNSSSIKFVYCGCFHPWTFGSWFIQFVNLK